MSDEAHRSQYGMKGRLDAKTGKYVYGYAKHLRDALKNATFIGFTGTPIALEDKDTPSGVWRLRQHLRHSGRGG
ncbi:MAG: hypothetical protein R3E56_06265 [Burkholderiaceae bacterium]